MISRIKNGKLQLQMINMLMQIVFVFFSIFFSIYVYSISNDLNLILSYNLFSSLVTILMGFIIVKFVKTRHYNILYRSSFLLSIISIALIFTINKTTIYMVFIVEFFYTLTSLCFYLPHEVAVMNKNNRTNLVSFVGISNILSLVASVLSPFISGVIIDYISYFTLFGIIILLTTICFVLSFWVRNAFWETPKIKMSNMFKGVFKIKRVKATLIAHGLNKFASGSVIEFLLPILLFLKVGTNFSVGFYAAIATLVGGIMLIIYLALFKYKNSWLITAVVLQIVCATILITWTSPIAFFIYYFINSAFKKIIAHRASWSVYSAIENTQYEIYKKEYWYVFNVCVESFKIIAFLLTFLIYNLWQNEIILSIIILGFTVMQLVPSILFIKADKMFEQEESVLKDESFKSKKSIVFDVFFNFFAKKVHFYKPFIKFSFLSQIFISGCFSKYTFKSLSLIKPYILF